MAQLIAVSGFAGVGKDEFFKIFSKKMASQGKKVERLAFADPIKVSVNRLLGWDERHSNGELKEVVDEFWGFSPRHAYQTFGTEWARNCLRNDFWLKLAEKSLLESAADFIIVTDLRFENEWEWSKARGGIVVGILGDRTKLENELHPSEQFIPKIVMGSDWLVKNDKSLGLSNLEKQVDLFISSKLDRK